jgi:hypothetical protein
MAQNSFKVKNGLNLTPVDLTTLSNPESGDIACDINDSNKIKRYDSVGAKWIEVGSGGDANVNALLTQTFDNAALTDFTQTGLSFATLAPLKGTQSALLTHQTGVSPTNDQSFKQTISVDRKFRGKSMNLSLFVRSTATQGNLTLRVRDESNSTNLIASEQIQTGSSPFTANTSSGSPTLSGISNADMALLQIGDAVSGPGIAVGTVITALGTNQVTISINATATATGASLRASALPARYAYSFTIPTSCSSLSYTITALPEANSPRSVIDDIVIELSNTALLETSVEVPVVTAWQGYTPTFQGFGTPTNVEFEWRQVGENIEIRGKATAGTTTAVEARVSLPASFTSSNTSIIPSIVMVGSYINGLTSTNSHGGPVLIEPSVSYVTLGSSSTYGSGSTNPSTKVNGTDISTGASFQMFASIPCAGLSATTTEVIPLTQSGMVQEPDTMLRFTAGNGFGSTNTSVRRFTTLAESYGSAVTWTDSATLGSYFTINEDGIYTISYSETSSANTVAAYAVISKNDPNISAFNLANMLAYDGALYNTANTNSKYMNANWTGRLVQGDIIYCGSVSPASNNGQSVALTFTKQGSLKQVSVSSDQKITIPTSELRFTDSSTAFGAVDSRIVYLDTIEKVVGDAFSINNNSNNGTVVTIRKAGILSVSASMTFTGVVGYFSITKNLDAAGLTDTAASGPEYLASSYTALSNNNVQSTAWTGKVNIGDIIRIKVITPTAPNGFSSFNLLHQEQDISVSVTNTLPQFSESDSSVRVATANGYGSLGTSVRRFSNLKDNYGSDITYLDSPTEGASFTIKTSGVYQISYSDQFNVSDNLGISKNSSSLSANINALSDTERLAIGRTTATNTADTVSWMGYLTAGDIIRAQTGASPSGAAPAYSQFTITKVGKPNVTGVDVTPFVNVPQPESQSSYIAFGAFGVATLTGALSTSVGSGVYSYNATSGIYTALKLCNVTLTLDGTAAAAAQAVLRIYVNGSNRASQHTDATAGRTATTALTARLNAGDTFYFSNDANSISSARGNVVATALSDQILTAPETFSTDSNALTYANAATYTLTTLSDAPVGTYITFTTAINTTNVHTQTTGTNRPTQTDADMNSNGILLYSRAYNAASIATQPAYIAIQIGKGMKGVTVNGYVATAKSGAAIKPDQSALSGTTVQIGAFIAYNEVTGVLLLDASTAWGSTYTSRYWVDNTGNARTQAYLTISASKNPALTGLGLGTVAARGVNTAGTSIANGGSGQTIVYDSAKTYDTHGALNTSTGIFTAPESGYYQVSWRVNLAGGGGFGAGEQFITLMYKNSSPYAYGEMQVDVGANTQQHSSVGSTGVYLNKSDTVDIRAFQDSGAAISLFTSVGANHFSIHKTSVGTGN